MMTKTMNTTMTTNRCYSDLLQMTAFEDRFDYLKIGGAVGMDTFGYDRIFNQQFYTSYEWLRLRDQVIARDEGNDLGVPGCRIIGHIIVHHMNPITMDDIRHSTDFLLNPEYLISTSLQTHNAIHYGASAPTIYRALTERYAGDTKLW